MKAIDAKGFVNQIVFWTREIGSIATCELIEKPLVVEKFRVSSPHSAK